MKILNTVEMHEVNAGGTSYATAKCKYWNKGCRTKMSVPYNNAWYCKWWTKKVAQKQVKAQINLHQNRYCIYKWW